MAALLLAQRFRKDAVPALKAALATATGPALRSELAEALATTGTRDVADTLAPLLKDKSLWVRQAVAIPLASVGDARGLAALEELARQPESEGLPVLHVLLGQQAFRRGDLATGIRELERSLDLRPYNVEVLVLLADAYMGRARERLEEALRFDPRHRGARQRMNLMKNGRGPR